MSKNSQGYMGIQVGKLGPAVGRLYRREQVYAAYQPHVSNPRTEAQQANRFRFKALMRLTRGFVPVAAMGLKAAAERSELHYRNLFTRLNATAVSTSQEPVVSYGELVVSRGPAVPVAFGEATASAGKITVVYAPNGDMPGAKMSDEVYVFVYHPTLGYGVLGGGMARSVGVVEVEMPERWVGATVHVYGLVRTTNMRPQWNEALQRQMLPHEVSDSTYVGEVVVV